MKHFARVFSLAILCHAFNSMPVKAQSTFTRVVDILQTNCASSGCHGNSGTTVFDISGSPADVYNALVNVNASNAGAASKNNKLISPGYPHRSFLLRKVAGELSPELNLEAAEGDPCPKNANPLTAVEKELIRQWIIYGSPQTGEVVNEQVLIDFYNGNALAEIAPPPPPPPGQGFQVHDGPIFLAPGEEREYQWKYRTELPEDVEVTRVQAVMSPQSHHYILYKYHPNSSLGTPEGHIRINDILGQADVQINASTIATWQYSRDHELPAGTAYIWEAGAALNSNFHIKNYSQDSILAAHTYLNVYTQPKGSGTVEMFSTLAVYGGMFNPFSLNVPNTGAPHTLSFEQTRNETWYIWILQAHTHQLGIDFNIFLRNEDGSRGEQIYMGYFDYENGFNRGYYDWAHPSVLEFSPLREIDMRNGLIHEATYLNNGPSNVGFGLTTADEMFITYMHYTKALPTSLRDIVASQNDFTVYPNPSNGSFMVRYDMPETGQLTIELFNLLGEKVALLKDASVSKGAFTEVINTQALNLPGGIYTLRLTSGNHAVMRKIVIQ